MREKYNFKNKGCHRWDQIVQPDKDNYVSTNFYEYEFIEKIMEVTSAATSSIFDYSSDETEDVNLLSIYPNPAESFINLELTSDVSVYDVSIIDLMGKEVYKSNSLSNPRIDISSLEIGNYIIVVNSNEGKQLGKFVKTK